MIKKKINSSKAKKRKEKKGFTLIELLAVVIILGVLMIIAIPSVTEYINSSRKNAYIKTASQYITGARNKINSSKIPLYDVNATYYLPADCISLEKGKDSPYGKFVEAYIVVTYDGFGYDYYWTSRDETNTGILLTDENLLNESSVLPGIKKISKNIAIGNKEKIFIINNCNSNDLTEEEVTEAIPVDGNLESDENTTKIYTHLEKLAVLDNVKSTYVSSETGINFNVKPSDTNGKGLYIRSGTENNAYPIYYYRGEVTNNNVIFANFCWKIVRTTETGGIKLIYNGEPENGECTQTGTSTQIGISKFNNNNDDNAYVGYMYGTPNSTTYGETHKNTNSSEVKIILDNWYKINILKNGYSFKVEDTVWCNDRSFATINTGTGTSDSITYYASRGRLTNSTPTPTLDCVNDNDKFTVKQENGNGALTYPIGLLTADELTLAGNGWNGYSSSSYLYNGEWWWTMSPIYYSGTPGAYIFRLTSTLYNSNVTVESGIRPALSLKKGTKFLPGGDGSVKKPYIVK